MNLRQLQSAFKNYVIRLTPDIEPQIIGRPGAPAAVRVQIYAQAYRLRLVDVLRDNFSALAAWLGEEEFDRLAMAFIDRNPSTNFSVRWFGDRLEKFLRTAEFFKARPALAEMAAFEWALAAAFDSNDDPVLKREDLATLPATEWPGLVLRFQSGLQRLDLEWNVVDIWLAIDEGGPLPALERGDVRPCLVWRKDLKSHFRVVSESEARVLEAARAGASFADLCAQLNEEGGDRDVAAEAAGLLQRWVSDELLVK